MTQNQPEPQPVPDDVAVPEGGFPGDQPAGDSEEFIPAPVGEQGNGELVEGEPGPEHIDPPQPTENVGDDAAVDEHGNERS